MKFPIKLSLAIFIVSGLALATANMSLAESWTERATNALNQARGAVEAAGETAGAQAQVMVQQGREAVRQVERALEDAGRAADAQVRRSSIRDIKRELRKVKRDLEATDRAVRAKLRELDRQAQEAYEALDRAAEAKAQEVYESVKENAVAIKEGLKAKGAEAKEIIKDSANACEFLVMEARKQVEGVFQETAAAIETKRKAVGDRVQEAHDRASATGEALLTVAALYAQAGIRSNVQDATTGIQLTEMLRKGDIQGAKQLSVVAAQNAAIDSFKNPVFAEMQLNIEQSFQNEMRQMEFNIRLRNEIIIQNALKNALNVNAEATVTPGALPDTRAAEKVYAEMAYQEMLKNPEMVALLTDEAAMNNAAMVYYEAARAYAEKVYGITLSPASKVFKTSEETAKDAEEERRKQMRLRGPRRHRRTVHHPCHH